jgi:hypothetical protein
MKTLTTLTLVGTLTALAACTAEIGEDSAEDVGGTEQAVTTLVNCSFSNGLCSGLIPDQESSYSSYWYNGGVLKAFNQIPSGVTARSRYEVVKKDLAPVDAGYQIYAAVKWIVPQPSYLSGNPNNRGGDVLQLIHYDSGPNCTSDKKYRPIYMFVVKQDKLEIARWINGNKEVKTLTGDYRSRSDWHRIEVSAKISNDSSGYFATKIDGVEVDRISGVTTLDNGACRVALKSGNYSAGYQAGPFASEVWIDDLYAERQ